MVRPSPVAERYFDRPSDGSDFPLQDPLKFEPKDPAYKIWCDFHVLPAFVGMAACQFSLALALFCVSLAHVLAQGWTEEASSPDNSSNSTGMGSPANKLFFEPFESLAFVRLGLSGVQVVGIVVGVLGLWKQSASHLVATLWGDSLAILGCFGYFLLLAYHSLVREDYFGFCFVGLSLLFVLVVNVLGAQAASECLAYLKDVNGFVDVAKRRWPDVERSALQSEDGVYRSKSSPIIRLLLRHYRVSRALIRQAEMEQNRFCPNDTPAFNIHCGKSIGVNCYKNSEFLSSACQLHTGCSVYHQ